MCVGAVSSHGSQRPCWGALFIQQTHPCVFQSWGILLQGVTGSHNAPQLNNRAEFGSEDIKQTHCKWHFYLLAFVSPPPHPSLTGICTAISRSPMATANLVNGGTTFSWCHHAMVIGGLWNVDEALIELSGSQWNWYFLRNRFNNTNFRFWHETWPWTIKAVSLFYLERSVF